MGPKDLFITPLYLIIFYLMAYYIRPKVSDVHTKRYFIPALTLKFIGATAVGVIYQFYYGGGDTFNFFTHGSQHIWEAFLESPRIGIQMLFSNGEYTSDNYKYASQIYFFKDSSSYFIIKISSILAFITFHTYSTIALLFAIISFGGLWAMYLSFYRLFPALHKSFAVAIFFVPSIFFWGSGLLKDTITLGALGFSTYCLVMIFFVKKKQLKNSILLLLSLYIIYNIKIYILICFIPASIIWIFWAFKGRVDSPILKTIIVPIFILGAILISYIVVQKVVEDNDKYSFEKIGTTAAITAYDIRFWTGRDAGSGYTLGELDGSMQSMLALAPAAINVSLFRPYLWEVNNPLMLISALESLLLFVFTVYVLFSVGLLRSVTIILSKPIVAFFLIFSISFAFAVGVSTFNFGTLVRYKIPMIPFYIIGLLIIKHYFRVSTDGSGIRPLGAHCNLKNLEIHNA